MTVRSDGGGVATTVLNYNGWRDTVPCLESLRSSRPSGSLIVVVDNGSTDESLGVLESSVREGEELLPLPHNLGFSGGMNEGIARCLRAGARFIFVLNNDTLVEPGVFDELLEYMSAHPDVGVGVPRVHLLATPEVSQFASLADTPVDTPDLLGCAFMVRADLLREVGFLDENFFLYWEDRDFFRRVEGGGHRVTYLPTQAKVLHRGGASTSKSGGRSSYFFLRNKFLFVRRYQNKPGALPRLVFQTLRRAAGWRVQPTWAMRALAGGIVLWLRNPPARWHTDSSDQGPA